MKSFGATIDYSQRRHVENADAWGGYGVSGIRRFGEFQIRFEKGHPAAVKLEASEVRGQSRGHNSDQKSEVSVRSRTLLSSL